MVRVRAAMIAADGQSSDELARNPFVNLHVVSPNYLGVSGAAGGTRRSVHDTAAQLAHDPWRNINEEPAANRTI
jgi:hypothetical protein